MEKTKSDRTVIYVISIVAGVIFLILVLGIMVCYRRYRIAKSGKFRNVKRVIVMRPVSLGWYISCIKLNKLNLQ